MAAEKGLVVEFEKRRPRRARNVGVEIAEGRLVVVATAGEREHHRRDLRPPAGAAGTLLVIGDAGRHIGVEGCLQIAKVDPQFHRRRTTEEIDAPFPEAILDLLARLRGDRRRVLSCEPDQRAPLTICPRVVIALVETPALRFGHRFQATTAAVGGTHPAQTNQLLEAAACAPVERQSAGGPEPHLLQIENEAAVTTEGAGGYDRADLPMHRPPPAGFEYFPRLRVTELECHLEEPRALIAPGCVRRRQPEHAAITGFLG